MWILNSVILFAALLGLLYGYRKGEELDLELDKKEHKLFFWYPLIQCILVCTKLEQVLLKKHHISEAVKAFHQTNKPELPVRLFWYQRIATALTVFVLFNLLSLFGTLVDSGGLSLVDGRYIERPGYGEGSSELELKVKVKQEKEASQQEDIPDSQEVTVKVGEQRYTQSEADQLFEKAIEYLQKDMLGNNPSLEGVSERLNFCKAIPGTSVRVTWVPEDYKLISADGSIHNEDIPEEGITTSVKAVLDYYELKKEHRITLYILPKKYSAEEQFKQNLAEEMNDLSVKTAARPFLELPSRIGDYKLSWEQKSSDPGLSLFILGLVAVFAVWSYGGRQLETRLKKRKEQMLLDYPEVINKFTLLINAGMTIRQTWIKIAEDYSSKRDSSQSQKRYLYEEMLVTVRELKLGIPEKTAYEQFGRRIGLIPYIKFCSLLSQNLVKGTRGFTELLILEASEAFEDRKEAAKRLGEEAGTKLLIPMMVLLILVFLVIMIPAFLSFRL